MAETAKTQIAQDTNPDAQKQAEKQQAQEVALNTFAAVAKEWHRVHKCTPNHAARIWRYMETDVLPHIGSLQLDEIRVSDIQALLERITARDVGNTAEKIRQWIGAVYEYAAQRELTERNPAKRLKGFVVQRETVHHRYLPLLAPIRAWGVLPAPERSPYRPRQPHSPIAAYPNLPPQQRTARGTMGRDRFSGCHLDDSQGTDEDEARA